MICEKSIKSQDIARKGKNHCRSLKGLCTGSPSRTATSCGGPERSRLGEGVNARPLELDGVVGDHQGVEVGGNSADQYQHSACEVQNLTCGENRG